MPAEEHTIAFEPVSETHVPMLARWLAEPHVRQWWGDPEEELELIRSGQASGEIDAYIVHVNAQPVAYIQSWQPSESDEEWARDLAPGTVGIDATIGQADMVNRGIGTQIVRAFARRLFAAGVPRLIIDPDGENTRAIRAYAKAGFTKFAEHRNAEGVTVLMEMTPRSFSRIL